MTFWGIEVKPEKPYVHHYTSDGGRLRLSQATLGTGTSTKKSIVQCNVGDKKPIYLCSLLPKKLETCALNLEFEEDEEVTFSVIGPHSVHLSGFFFGEDENEDEGDSDPFEGHIIETDSEADDSIGYDTEEEDEDDFIDDSDDDLDMYPSSPVRPSGVKIEEILDDENPAKENGMSKQTKKKKHPQTSKSSDTENSGKQIVLKSSTQIPVLESEDEDGFPIPSPGKRKTDDINSKLMSEESKDENTGEDAHKKKDTDELGPKKRLKRKINAVGQDDGDLRGAGKIHDPSMQTNEANSANNSKRKKKNKKKKETDEEELAMDTENKSTIPKEANSRDMEQSIEKLKENEKKKKKNKKHKNVVGANTEQNVADKSGSTIEEKAEAEPFQVRSFPNGLVIEEVAMGKPDGKKAVPGKKVSVRYVGKLKKNGKIFDSNIGRAPFKFRIGIGQVIKGWDVGVNGMRVGDKRRLTIPPAMGYGSRGAGGAIPPNSWLVFDVELIEVN